MVAQKEKRPCVFLESETLMSGEGSGKAGSNQSLCLGALAENPVWAGGSDACSGCTSPSLPSLPAVFLGYRALGFLCSGGPESKAVLVPV